MNVMTIRTKAILMNATLAVVLVLLLRYYPAYAVAVAAAILFSVGNLGLVLKARRTRRKSESD